MKLVPTGAKAPNHIPLPSGLTPRGSWFGDNAGPKEACDSARWDFSPEFVRYLGMGVGAEVNLVRDPATGRLCAEKLFRSKPSVSAFIRDTLYWVCFQAPFPYRTNMDAIQAAVFRRKVLRSLTEFWFGRPLVAEAWYTRWDDTAKAYVLGTEYVAGRGPRPAEYNPHILRDFFRNSAGRLANRVFRAETQKVTSTRWEIDEVTHWLDELKTRFHEAYLISRYKLDP